MKKITFILALIWAFGCGVANAQMPNIPELPFDPQVTKGTLPNGLTYYIQHNENPKERAYFYIAQKVGSVQEDENQRGLAHFLEHMCFNGSEHFAGNGVVNFCQKIGVQFGQHLNAYTAADRTVYNIDNVPTTDPTNLDSCLYILYDWAHALTLDPKEIDKERGVIHEEWRVRNSGQNRILERQLPNIFKDSKYGHRFPIGLMSVVDNFKPEVLRAYYDKWYRPDNQGIIVIGDIDVKQMEEKIKNIFGKLPAPAADAVQVEDVPIPDNEEPIFVIDKDKEVTAPTLAVMLKHDLLPRQLRNTAAGLANDFMTTIITTMLNYRIQDLMQNPDVPAAGIYAHDGVFVMTFSKNALQLSCRPKDGKDKEALATLMREMRRVALYGFTEPEYKRALSDLEAMINQQIESRKTVKTSELVDECVEHFLMNEAKTDFDQKMQMYRQIGQNVPLTVINQSAQQLLGDMKKNLVVLGFYPEKEGVAVPTVEDAAAILAAIKAEDIKPYEAKVIDTKLIEKEPKAGTIKKELPADALGYKGLVLSNGVTVKYKSTDFDEGKILFKALSFGGTFKVDKKELDNAAIFNAVMANNGLGKFNGNDLEKALTGRIVSMHPSLTTATESLSGSSSKKDFKTLLQLAYLYFTEINYDTINYKTVYKQQETMLANRDANPFTALSDSLQMNLNNYSEYAKPFTMKALKNVSYDGILKIYKERFANVADFTFIFTGALNEDSLKFYAKQYLASIPVKGKLEKFTNPGTHFFKGAKVCRFSKKMETPQCYVVNLLTGTCPINAENTVLGEAVGQLLDIHFTETIREKHSFAYSTSTRCNVDNFYGDEGYLAQIVAPVKPEKCDSTILLINQGVEEIAKAGIPAEKLAKVKEQMLKEYETNQRENAYWHGGEEDLVLYKKTSLPGAKKAIEGLTSEQIQNFVKNNILKQGNNLYVIIEPEK